MQVDYNAAAEIYAITQTGAKRHMFHRRFSTTAEALQFAIEALPPKTTNVLLEVDEERFEGPTIRELYDAGDYPLARHADGAAAPATPR